MHKICYSFKKDSVTIEYNKQYICFHSYTMNEKGKFRDFKKQLSNFQPQDIHEVYGMARESNVGAMAGHKPIDSIIIF